MLDVDERDRKISLGMKQIEPNPWSADRGALPGRHAGVAARSATSPTSGSSSASRRASTAWCTSRTSRGRSRSSIRRSVQEGRRGRGDRAEDRQGEREVLARHQAAAAESRGTTSCASTRWAREVTGDGHERHRLRRVRAARGRHRGADLHLGARAAADRRCRPSTVKEGQTREALVVTRRCQRAEDLVVDPGRARQAERAALQRAGGPAVRDPDARRSAISSRRSCRPRRGTSRTREQSAAPGNPGAPVAAPCSTSEGTHDEERLDRGGGASGRRTSRRRTPRSSSTRSSTR